MKVTQVAKMSLEFIDDTKRVANVVKPKMNKGFKRVGDITIQFCTQDGDNVVQNCVTVITTFNIFKKPRYVN